MHAEIVSLKEQLSIAYGRNKKPVAFIDESYQSVREGRPFYLVSATVFGADQLDEHRNLCVEIADGFWWHTTSAFQNRQNLDIQSFIQLLTSRHVTNLGSIQLEINRNDLEHARRQCLLQIIKHLEASGCGLIVIERRQNQSARRSDAALFSAAAGEGYVSKHLRLIQSTPSAEQLLWLPDIMSWTLRRYFAVNDSAWISLFSGNLSLMDVSSEQILHSKIDFGESNLKTKRSQLAVAKSCDPEKPIDSVNEGVSRSSDSIMPQQPVSLQHFPQNFGQVIPPPIDPVMLSAWLKSRFPK